MAHRLQQLVLSSNFFGDVLIQKMAEYFDHPYALQDLRLLQLDKNVITGRTFPIWTQYFPVDYTKRVNYLESLVLGAEFFGNPLLGDGGVADLVAILTYPVEYPITAEVEEE